MRSFMWFKSVIFIDYTIFLLTYPRKRGQGEKGLVNEGTIPHDPFFQSSEEMCHSANL